MQVSLHTGTMGNTTADPTWISRANAYAHVFECSSIEARDKARTHKIPGETSIWFRVWGLGSRFMLMVYALGVHTLPARRDEHPSGIGTKIIDSSTTTPCIHTDAFWLGSQRRRRGLLMGGRQYGVPCVYSLNQCSVPEHVH